MSYLRTLIGRYWIALAVNLVAVIAASLVVATVVQPPETDKQVRVITDKDEIRQLGSDFVIERVREMIPEADDDALRDADPGAPLSTVQRVAPIITSPDSPVREDEELLFASPDELATIIRNQMPKCAKSTAGEPVNLEVIEEYNPGRLGVRILGIRSAKLATQRYGDPERARSNTTFVEVLAEVTNERSTSYYSIGETVLLTQDGSIIQSDFISAPDDIRDITPGETVAGVALFRVADSKLSDEFTVVGTGRSNARSVALAMGRGACATVAVTEADTVGDHPKVIDGELVKG